MLVLGGCDGGVSYNAETNAAQEAQDESGQVVGGSRSTYGKARDQAENVVDQHEQRQEEMMQMMQPPEE